MWIKILTNNTQGLEDVLTGRFHADLMYVVAKVKRHGLALKKCHYIKLDDKVAAFLDAESPVKLAMAFAEFEAADDVKLFSPLSLEAKDILINCSTHHKLLDRKLAILKYLGVKI